MRGSALCRTSASRSDSSSEARKVTMSGGGSSRSRVQTARTIRWRLARSSMTSLSSLSSVRMPSLLCQSSTRPGSLGAACGSVAWANPSSGLGEMISRCGASIAVSPGNGARGCWRTRGRSGPGNRGNRSESPDTDGRTRRRSTAASVASTLRAMRTAVALASTSPTATPAAARRTRGDRDRAAATTSPSSVRTSWMPWGSVETTVSNGPRWVGVKWIGGGRGVASGTRTSGSRDMAASTPALLNGMRSSAATA
jgi:hypothetical protein